MLHRGDGVVLSAGGGLLLGFLCRASGEREAPRGEGAPGGSAGVREEDEHAAAGRGGFSGPVCDVTAAREAPALQKQNHLGFYTSS